MRRSFFGGCNRSTQSSQSSVSSPQACHALCTSGSSRPLTYPQNYPPNAHSFSEAHGRRRCDPQQHLNGTSTATYAHGGKYMLRSAMENGESGQRVPTRKRSSRKGLPRRFTCEHPGCSKQYSRAEHLQRHSLNHEPKRIFRCQSDGCYQTFVRQDLFDRHVEKHSHTQSWPQISRGTVSTQDECDTIMDQMHETIGQHHDVANPSPLRQSVDDGLLGHASILAPTDWGFAAQPFDNASLETAQVNDSFAAWLLSPLGSHGWDLDIAQLPSSNYASYNDNENSSDNGIPTPLPGLGEYNDPAMGIGVAEVRSNIPLELPGSRESWLHISIRRLCKINDILLSFHNKNAAHLRITHATVESLVYRGPESTWPNLNTSVLERCVMTFWQDVAPQIPIVHRATFSAEHSPLPLLLAIVSLGAAHVVRINDPNTLSDYRSLADLIITGLRWEIHTSEDAQPPVNLWVAQSLLLLEFYEKLFSSRQLHERAHIHHVSTLTLLRRGSPLGGRPGADTPLQGPTTPDHAHNDETVETHSLPDLDTWWRRWANNESMLRVVFMAYEMDTLHAAMFGHESSLLPSDVGLTLPCDDTLWNAKSADAVRQLETTFSLCGIKSKKFLDGLKEYLHGDSSPSHLRARLTSVVGLLSVGCHIRPREKHNKLFETIPSQAERKKWTTMMLKALDQWKNGLDNALSTASFYGAGLTRQGLTPEPTVLYHLAYITMHIDILNCQILAGTELLLGRRVSRKELATATAYATSWASTAEARLAVLHSFKLLSHTLVEPWTQEPESEPLSKKSTRYSARSDPCFYRPWCLYLAALTIWTYQYIVGERQTEDAATEFVAEKCVDDLAYSYISDLAKGDDYDKLLERTSDHGCSALLQTLSDNLALAEPTILVEASSRLLKCRSLLASRQASPFTN